MKDSQSTHTPNDGGIHTNHYKNKPDEVFDAELAAEMAKRTDKLGDTSIELAVRVKQAREFIAWSVNHMRTSWLDWMENADKSLKDVTMLRMALERETKTAIATGKDIRDFFNSKEYAESAAKMKEMVELMEWFQKLKADGVMDAFSDFILKVCK